MAVRPSSSRHWSVRSVGFLLLFISTDWIEIIQNHSIERRTFLFFIINAHMRAQQSPQESCARRWCDYLHLQSPPADVGAGAQYVYPCPSVPHKPNPNHPTGFLTFLPICFYWTRHLRWPQRILRQRLAPMRTRTTYWSRPGGLRTAGADARPASRASAGGAIPERERAGRRRRGR